MSYELRILMNSAINPKTGTPMPIHPMEAHLWTGARDTYGKKVPDHLAKYTTVKGAHLAPYFKGQDPKQPSVLLNSLLAAYPPSSAIQKNQSWTEKDHELFKETLMWYASQGNNLFSGVLTRS
jgi:hypothetical protein